MAVSWYDAHWKINVYLINEKDLWTPQKLNVKKSMKSQQLRKNLTKMIAKDMLSISSENQALYLLQMSRMALNLKW